MLAGFLLIFLATAATKVLADGAGPTWPDYANVVWGQETNFVRGDRDFNRNALQASLRAGVETSDKTIVLSGNPLKPAAPARLFVQNALGPDISQFPTTTNDGVITTVVPSTNWVLFDLPPVNERFSLYATDSNGKPVRKTAAGKSVGQPTSLKAGTFYGTFERKNHGHVAMLPGDRFEMPLSDFSKIRVPLTAESDSEIWNFNPAKYFTFKASELYTLKVTLHLYVSDTNGFLQPIDLPPVDLCVRVK